MSDGPKWRRRAEARPAEIADAALAEFAARGYAAARLADIAARAGISKAALYRYYRDKEALFRAALLDRLTPRVDAIAPGGAGGPGEALVRVAAVLSDPQVGRLARVVIGESGNFPELARAWHDVVAAPALAALGAAIERGQAAGNVRAGEPRLLALSVVGPMLMGAIWREVIEPVGGAPLDLQALAREHALTLAGGLAVRQ